MGQITSPYKFEKGSLPSLKGQSFPLTFHTEPEEAVAAGHYDSVATIMRCANAQLKIKQGHAAQRASKEKVRKNEKGETVGRDGSKLTLAELAAIARGTVAVASERTRGGGVTNKEATKIGRQLREKAAELSPATIAELRAKGFNIGDVAPASTPAPTKGAAKK